MGRYTDTISYPYIENIFTWYISYCFDIWKRTSRIKEERSNVLVVRLLKNIFLPNKNTIKLINTKLPNISWSPLY